MSWATVGVVVSELVSVLCAVQLWRKSDRVWRKALWTSILAIPGLGPLLYAGVYDLPDVQATHERAGHEHTQQGW
jgi:hypothetical protein